MTGLDHSPISRKLPKAVLPVRTWKVKVFYINNTQETSLVSQLLSIKEKYLPCYHLGDRWALQAGSESLNVDRGQEQSHLIIEIHCDHETYFGKEKNVYSLRNSHDP